MFVSIISLLRRLLLCLDKNFLSKDVSDTSSGLWPIQIEGELFNTEGEHSSLLVFTNIKQSWQIFTKQQLLTRIIQLNERDN